MNKTEYNFFIRYLKENGLYTEFFREIKRQHNRNRRNNIPFKKYCKVIKSISILMNCIHWESARKRIWREQWYSYNRFFSNNYYNYAKNNSKNT